MNDKVYNSLEEIHVLLDRGGYKLSVDIDVDGLEPFLVSVLEVRKEGDFWFYCDVDWTPPCIVDFLSRTGRVVSSKLVVRGSVYLPSPAVVGACFWHTDFQNLMERPASDATSTPGIKSIAYFGNIVERLKLAQIELLKMFSDGGAAMLAYDSVDQAGCPEGADS